MHSPDRFFRHPQSSKRGSRGHSSHLSCFNVLTALWASVRLGTPSRSRNPCGLKNDLLCSRPLRACSHLENCELSRFCIAHCVRWVAQLHQKTSFVLSRWMRQASSTELPEAFTCPATLDRPVRLDFQKPSLVLTTLGQARSTGCQKPCTNSPASAGQAGSTGLF